MKKVCAKKIVSGVLSVAMLLSASVSAMAARATSVVKYDVQNTEYTITTDVAGIKSGEMVTYMVHNASNFYSITPDKIKYVDQKTAAYQAAQFTYQGTGSWSDLKDGMKIYVGAESLSTPIQTVPEDTVAKTMVFVNGAIDSSAEVTTTDIGDGFKCDVTVSSAPYVAEVYLNSEKVDFYRTADSIGFFTKTDLTVDDDIKLTTRAVVYSAKDYYEDGSYVNKYPNIHGVTDETGASSTFVKLADVLANNSNRSEPYSYVYKNTKTMGELYDDPDKTWTTSLKDISDAGKVLTVSDADVEAQRREYYGYNGGDVKSNSSYATPNPTPTTTDENGNATTEVVTFDVSNIVPQGIYLNSDVITVDVNVPANGNYKLLTHAHTFAVDTRKVEAKLYDASNELGTFTTVGAQYDFGYGLSDTEIYLEAGNYTVQLKGAGGLVRLDYMALLPATEATIAAFESGDSAIEEYIAASEAIDDTYVAIELGHVKIKGKSLIAFARAAGSFSEAGIMVDGVKYAASAVSGSADKGYGYGGFAIELFDENGVSDLEDKVVNAYVTNGTEDITVGNVIPTVVGQ